MPSNPSGDGQFHDNLSWDRLQALLSWFEDFNREEDAKVEALMRGDTEQYPVWPVTLKEQDQIWSTRFKLGTAEDRCERLAQEAALYVLCNSIAHES